MGGKSSGVFVISLISVPSLILMVGFMSKALSRILFPILLASPYTSVIVFFRYSLFCELMSLATSVWMIENTATMPYHIVCLGLFWFPAFEFRWLGTLYKRTDGKI